ncbi:hypothetical protein LJR230_002066 [Trinickia sp. LjRoot230]|uniref:hypothetical protein n=1 Tax=Trinickia sp. LjRoot230 TaxID=3342288 RepID=UPI003ECD43EA
MSEAQLYMPDQLIKDAAKHGELVVFVGAGASMLCGSPDWREFANQVVSALEKSGALGFLEAEQLRGLGDSRRTLSIAMALAKEKDVAIDFDRILHPTKPAAIGAELYQLLSSLRPVFVTTNYDKWLDNAGQEGLSAEVKAGGESEPVKGPSKRPKHYLRKHFDRAGFFNVEHSPKVKVVESERGTMYQAEGWPALRYLEQIAASARGDQATRIAGIVRAISSDAQQRGLDNWRTWWSLATILSQLPLDVVTDQDVDMIRSWLAGRFESNMVGQELGEKLLPRLLDSSEPENWHRAMMLVDALSMARRTGES